MRDLMFEKYYCMFGQFQKNINQMSIKPSDENFTKSDINLTKLSKK